MPIQTQTLRYAITLPLVYVRNLKTQTLRYANADPGVKVR
jgi:hypothetical protein